jgi:hypothetical protein
MECMSYKEAWNVCRTKRLGMYVVQRGLRFFCCPFSYFTRFTSIPRRLKGGNLNDKILTIKNKVSTKPLRKTKR